MIPLPVSIAVCVLVSFFGGGSLWFSMAAHREEARVGVNIALEKIHALEEKLGKKFKKGQKKLLHLFHQSDVDGDGRVSVAELVKNMPVQQHNDEVPITFWTERNITIITLVNALVLCVVGFLFHQRYHASLLAAIHGKGKLSVKVLRCDNLHKEGGKVAKPYVVATVGKSHDKTAVRVGPNPIFDEPHKEHQDPKHEENKHQFHFDIDFDNKKVDMHDLVLEVFDHDGWVRSTSVGSLSIDVRDFAEYQGQTIRKRQTLKNGHEGLIEIEATFVEDKAKPVVVKKAALH